MAEEFPEEWGQRRRRREEERRRLMAQAAATPESDVPEAADPEPVAPAPPLSRRELRRQASGSVPVATPAVPPDGGSPTSGRGVSWAAPPVRGDVPTTPTARVNVPLVEPLPPRPAGPATAEQPVVPPAAPEPVAPTVRSRRQLRQPTGEAPLVGITPPPVTGGIRRLGPDGRLSPVEPVGPAEPAPPTGELPSPAERSAALRAQAERAQAEREQVAEERVRAAQERAARERAEREREQAERRARAEQLRQERERLEAERVAELRLERERLEAERAAERAAADRLMAERAEAERQAAERVEGERLAAQLAASQRAAEQAAVAPVALDPATGDRGPGVPEPVAPAPSTPGAPERLEPSAGTVQPDAERVARERAEQIARERAERERVLAAERERTAAAARDERPVAPVSRFGPTAAEAPPVPHWPAILPAATTWEAGDPARAAEPGAARRAEVVAPGAGDLLRPEVADGPDDETDAPHSRPYSWVHWLALAVVAFVLGMLIIMVIRQDAAAATGADAAARAVVDVLVTGPGVR